MRRINNFMYMDKWIFISALILSFIGILMVFSASTISAIHMYDVPQTYFLIRQSIFVVLGLVLFLIIALIPYKNYSKIIFPGIVLIYISLFLVLFSLNINGTKGWITIGNYNIQPSEFAKIAIIVFTAYHYNRYQRRLNNFHYAFYYPILFIAPMIFMVLLQPDFGTGIILIVLFGILFVSSGLKLKIIIQAFLKSLIPAILVLFMGTIYTGGNLLKGYQIERLKNFAEPCDSFGGSGWQVCNGFIAINNGGMLGAGLGESSQKYLYLPEAHTDFIFPIILEELGLLFGLFILILYGIIIFRGLNIAKRVQDVFGSLLALGVASMLFFHLLINLGGVFGIIPLTGVPLPLLSYGGSSVLTIFIGLGILQSVAMNVNYNISIGKD